MFKRKQESPEKRSLILKGFLKLVGGMLSILSLPAVRNFLWERATGKAKEKIVDAEARVVEKEEKKKPKKRLFG